MGMIRGITVILVNQVQTEKNDLFGRPIYEEVEEAVENVLVSPGSTTAVVSDQDLTGKKTVYTLAIPKGDTHNWENCKVRFWGQTWKSFGHPVEGIDANIPLDWNKKVMVERYG